jgi:hypothetical protein
MKKLNVGDYVICIKSLYDGGSINGSLLGYIPNNSYKITFINKKEIGVETDLKGYSKSFYLEVKDECVACLWDYFSLIKDVRKKKLSKLKIFLEG